MTASSGETRQHSLKNNCIITFISGPLRGTTKHWGRDQHFRLNVLGYSSWCDVIKSPLEAWMESPISLPEIIAFTGVHPPAHSHSPHPRRRELNTVYFTRRIVESYSQLGTGIIICNHGVTKIPEADGYEWGRHSSISPFPYKTTVSQSRPVQPPLLTRTKYCLLYLTDNRQLHLRSFGTQAMRTSLF